MTAAGVASQRPCRLLEDRSSRSTDLGCPFPLPDPGALTTAPVAPSADGHPGCGRREKTGTRSGSRPRPRRSACAPETARRTATFGIWKRGARTSRLFAAAFSAFAAVFAFFSFGWIPLLALIPATRWWPSCPPSPPAPEERPAEPRRGFYRAPVRAQLNTASRRFRGASTTGWRCTRW
jgi:hypothetical protein